MSFKHSALYQKQNGKCFYCGAELIIGSNKAQGWSLDHKTPRSKGGNNHYSNFVLCCRLCNSVKRDMEFETFETILKVMPSFVENMTLSQWVRIVKKAHQLHELTNPEMSRIQCLLTILSGESKSETLDSFVKSLAGELENE